MFKGLSDIYKKIKEGANSEIDIPFKPYEEEVKAPMTEERQERKTMTPVIKPVDDTNNIELKLVRPTSFAEVSTIADYLLDGCTVVLNMEVLDEAQTLRMLDFLNGVTYSNDGEIKNVAKSTYIITPHNVDVSGEDSSEE